MILKISLFKIVSILLKALELKQGPRELKKSVRALSPKYAPKIRIFAFYYIFSLQFSKVSEGPGHSGTKSILGAHLGFL